MATFTSTKRQTSNWQQNIELSPKIDVLEDKIAISQVTRVALPDVPCNATHDDASASQLPIR